MSTPYALLMWPTIYKRAKKKIGMTDKCRFFQHKVLTEIGGGSLASKRPSKGRRNNFKFAAVFVLACF